MKRKSMITMALAAALTLAFSFCSFAGEWMRDATGWYYQNTNGSYLSDGWYWIGGKSYYFNRQGYCLTSATTPDGYTVDDSGAWTVNGVVQTRETEVPVLSVRAVIPNGYDYEKETDPDSVTLNEKNGSDQAILIMVLPEEGISEIQSSLGEAGLKMLCDKVVKGMAQDVGVNMAMLSSSTKSFPTGAWYYYSYTGTSTDGAPLPVEFYLSFSGTQIRIVVLASGAGREFTTSDEFMQNCIR